jgi:hypothetical protein
MIFARTPGESDFAARVLHLLTEATGEMGGRLLRRLERVSQSVDVGAAPQEGLRWRIGPHRMVRGDLLQLASSGCGFFDGPARL